MRTDGWVPQVEVAHLSDPPYVRGAGVQIALNFNNKSLGMAKGIDRSDDCSSFL